MGKIMRDIVSNFTVVHNDFLEDRQMSLAERGLLITLLELPDNWNFSIEGLASIVKDGKYKVATTLNSLKQKGYFRRIRIIDNFGRVLDWLYEFSDEPHPEWITDEEFSTEVRDTPLSDNSDVGKADMENQTQSNINKSNNQKYCCDNQPKIDEKTEEKKEFSDEFSTLSTTFNSKTDETNKTEDKTFNYNAYSQIVKSNIDYDTLCVEEGKIIIDSIKDIIIDACITEKSVIRVGKKNVSADKVKKNLLKVNSEQVRSLVYATKNKSIKRYRAYVITALYNAVEDNGKVETAPQEFQTYSTDELSFLAEACDFTFNDNQMQYIHNVLLPIVPCCKHSSSHNDVELERFDFLRQKYLYMMARDSIKHIRNKFAYFCVILDKELEKQEKAEKNKPSYDLALYLSDRNI